MHFDRIENVNNQSQREGGRPKLIVFHTTEGGNEDSLIAEFNDSESDASAHVITTADGKIIRCVPDNKKAWTQCSFNPYCLSDEQIAFASDSRSNWFNRPAQLMAAAKIAAYWSVTHHIPLRRGIIAPGQLSILRTGIVQHKDLGGIGCGHSDCGTGWPQGYVTRLAQLIVVEHYENRRGSKQSIRLRKKLNRTRERYGLRPLAKVRN
jgi:N-acetylmuramoyl-L-alanine amidase-like protein